MDSEKKYKFVVVGNKRIPNGQVMNALTQGIGGLVALAAATRPALLEHMKFIDYPDGSGESHPSISARSLIVLRGKAGDLRKLRAGCKEKGLLFVDFHDQMTGDTYIEQLDRTARTPESELIYYAVAAFGLADELDPLTRHLSLWN